MVLMTVGVVFVILVVGLAFVMDVLFQDTKPDAKPKQEIDDSSCLLVDNGEEIGDDVCWTL